MYRERQNSVIGPAIAQVGFKFDQDSEYIAILFFFEFKIYMTNVDNLKL